MKTERITLPIYNLEYGGEGSLTVEWILARAPGVVRAHINSATEMAYVEYDPALTDAEQLRATLDRAGFGAPPPEVPAEPSVTASVTERRPAAVDSCRLALTGGLWLAALYTLCIAVGLLFPGRFSMVMVRFWELVLVGFDWANRWSLPLGLVEAFLLGALGAWALAVLYNALSVQTGR